MQVSFPSHPLNVMPMPQLVTSSSNYYNGQQFYQEASYSIPSMTREEANADLRRMLNIV